MLTELRDTVPLVMKCEGVDPNDATEETGWRRSRKSRTRPNRARSARFTGNDYADAT